MAQYGGRVSWYRDLPGSGQAGSGFRPAGQTRAPPMRVNAQRFEQVLDVTVCAGEHVQDAGHLAGIDAGLGERARRRYGRS